MVFAGHLLAQVTLGLLPGYRTAVAAAAAVAAATAEGLRFHLIPTAGDHQHGLRTNTSLWESISHADSIISQNC